MGTISQVSGSAMHGTWPDAGMVPHDWRGRFVIVARKSPHSSADHLECELPEEQSLPRDKRMICMLSPSDLVELSEGRQQQVAGTLGLRLEKLPY